MRNLTPLGDELILLDVEVRPDLLDVFVSEHVISLNMLAG